MLKAPAVYAFCVLGTMLVPARSIAGGYQLGPQDHLRVKVYDFRQASGEMHEWTGLVGDFVVNPSGNVSFPYVGEIPAAGFSTAQLAQTLGEKLQRTAGLAQSPVASVEITEFRPFYVVGVVEKPGEYAFRPGMSVLQAFSRAGGVQRLQEMNLYGLQRDAASSRGELEGLLSEQARLKIRLARLEAQIGNAEAFSLDPSDPEDADAEIGKAAAQERQLLQSARTIAAAQRAALAQTKKFLQEEIVTLGTKSEKIDLQLSLAQRDLTAVNGLVAKGLAVSTRQTALEESIAQLQSSQIDIDLSVARAKADIARADREYVDLESKTRTQLLTETAEVQSHLDALVVKIATARTLSAQAEAGADVATDLRQEKLRFSIGRRDSSGRLSNIPAAEGDLLQPGDTLKVERDHSKVAGSLSGPSLAYDDR